MPLKAGRKILNVLVTEKQLDAIHALATAAGYRSSADYVRALIEADSKKRGRPLTFDNVRWGGFRPATSDDT